MRPAYQWQTTKQLSIVANLITGSSQVEVSQLSKVEDKAQCFWCMNSILRLSIIVETGGEQKTWKSETSRRESSPAPKVWPDFFNLKIPPGLNQGVSSCFVSISGGNYSEILSPNLMMKAQFKDFSLDPPFGHPNGHVRCGRQGDEA